jgi:hypothetical protein
VELSQEYGTRVHLLTIEGSSSSPTLRQESDTVTTIAREEMETFLTVKSTNAPVSAAPTASTVITPDSLQTIPASPTTYTAEPVPLPTIAIGEVVETEIKGYLASLSATERVSLTTALKTGAGVPAEHDGRLLARMRTAIRRPLDQPEKAKLRRALKKELGI